MARPRRLTTCVLLSALALALFPRATAQDAKSPKQDAKTGAVDFVARWFDKARAAERAGKLDDARASYERVLERQSDHLPAIAGLVAVDRATNKIDEALWYADRFLEKWRHLKSKPAELGKTRDELARFVHEADPLRAKLDKQRREYVSRLLQIANEQMDHLAWHSARAILKEALATDPEHPDLAAGLTRIAKEGGNELAISDETGGSDPFEGVTPEWVAKNDPLHVEWDKAWELDTEHYKIRTDAGWRVLKTCAHAMEQVQVFYRQFHQYKTKGEAIPIAEVQMFKNRDEFTKIGKPPVDWAAGFWNGTAVVTYDQRQGGDGSLKDTLEVLFHEASHQFTTLAGGTGVPAWLNEGMASFFEGTVLLSNGKLDWNLVVPGRLYPLVDDLRKPDRHKLADVIAGKVEDYRVNYPWGWGVCYYLYNAEDAAGRLLYRPLMQEYFQKYSGENHVERFTDFFVTRPKVQGIATLDDWEKAFIAWILDLEAMDKGKLDAARRYEERGDQQIALGEALRAVELYSRSLERDPDHPDVLWKLAGALEKAKQGDRAAGVLRQWLAVTAPDSAPDDDEELADDGADATAPAKPAADADPAAAKRRDVARRIAKLDTTAKRLAEMRTKYHADALALAAEYDAQGYGYMAAMVLRGPATATPPNRDAIARYFAVSKKYELQLERWRLLFDEQTLKGFYGAGEDEFSVVDGAIVANIGGGAAPAQPSTGGAATPASAPAPKSATFAFSRLFVDERPSGDWSLSAEIQLDRGARMAGLCFGKKQDGDFHGLVILPEGYVDLGRFGTDGAPLVRQRVELTPGWHRLRLDVAGTRLVASLDGHEVMDHLFASRAEIRGDFGLLAGVGKSSFRDVKLLDFDPSLPRRTKIGRRPSVAQPDAKELTRAPAGQEHYSQQFPPLLRVERWIGNPPGGGDLDRLRNWPVLVVFWSTYQERVVPVLPGLEKIAKAHEGLGIPILLVTDDDEKSLDAFLATRPVAFPIGVNHVHAAFDDYAIAKVHLPHAKLVDVDGRVVWEGNPDWQAEFSSSLLEEPVAELVKRARLAELKDADAKIVEAKSAFASGDFARANELATAIAKLGVAYPAVDDAKELCARVEREAEARVATSEALAQNGRPLQSARALEEAAKLFAGCKATADVAAKLEKRTKTSAYQAAKGLENKLKQVEQHLKQGNLDKARASLDAVTTKLDAKSDAWLAERARWIAGEIAADKGAKDAKALFASYVQRFPGAATP